MAVNNQADLENLNLAYSIDQISLEKLLEQLPKDRQRFFMFGVPTYNNLGDLAIAYAEKRFFEKNFPEIVYVEITEPQTDTAIKALLPHLRSDDMIGYSGGGNIGSFYLNHETARRKVFSTFTDNKTISFPQSVNFADTEQGQKELALSVEAYGKNPNLTIVARETQSYDYFKEHFHNEVIYTADIVLSLQPDRPDFTRDGILYVMREDDEKVTSDQLLATLTDHLKYLGEDVEQTDTVVPFKIYDGDDLESGNKDVVRLSEINWLFERKLDQIKSSEVVVTDRLHGMIFCVITQTPCLVFDNSYGKASSSYYNWFEDLKYIQHTTEKDPEKLVPMIQELAAIKKTYPHDFSKSYDALKELINK